MYKVEGYNPEHNDWFWLKVLADGTVDCDGRVEGCQECHSALKSNDYVWDRRTHFPFEVTFGDI